MHFETHLNDCFHSQMMEWRLRVCKFQSNEFPYGILCKQEIAKITLLLRGRCSGRWHWLQGKLFWQHETDMEEMAEWSSAVATVGRRLGGLVLVVRWPWGLVSGLGVWLRRSGLWRPGRLNTDPSCTASYPHSDCQAKHGRWGWLHTILCVTVTTITAQVNSTLPPASSLHLTLQLSHLARTLYCC